MPPVALNSSRSGCTLNLAIGTEPLAQLVLLDACTEDLVRIEHLMQFYNHDLSEWCPIEFGDSGLYNLRPKAQYWARPSVRPYVARINGELAGFAVVDEEVLDASSDFNLGYFFLARRYRGRGLAQDMARQIFNRHEGQWEVCFIANNQPAARFWPKAIGQVSGEGVKVQDIVHDEMACRLYMFSIRALGELQSRLKPCPDSS